MPDFPGRDPGARVHPATPGKPDTAHLPTPPRVGVIGGGIAGVTAAVALAERGVRVTLYEREDTLGGRVRGWATGDAGRTMSRGFHAFFRQYYNLRALLRRVDPDLAMFRPVADYPLLHSNGTRESFANLPRTPPWNVASFVLRSDTFTVRDLARMNPAAALSLFDISVPKVYDALDAMDAATYLRHIGFPPAARHLAFEVFSRSFFAHPTTLSAAELATMFHIYFLGSSEGLLFDVPHDTYPRTIWEPLHAHLRSIGVTVHTGTPVDRVDGHRVAGQDHDALVLALDVRGLKRLVAHSTIGDTAWRHGVDSLATAPPFLVTRLWLDTPVRADRPPFLGTSGFPHLDNISVLDHFEAESAHWRSTTGGSVVELHAYALDTEPGDALVEQLRHIYPELAHAKALHTEHVLADDCPLFAPGTFHTRPAITTPDPSVVLAGDLTRVDLPVALMERAATSGFQAANTLLARWGIRGHDLWTVPNGARSPLLRAMANRRRPTAPPARVPSAHR